MAHFTVIGLGRFGLTASLELIHLGHTVSGIDSNEKLAEQYANDLTQTLICDATDERSMAELNLRSSAAVLVAIGEDMQASLLCVLHLKQLGVRQIWVKATSTAHHTILSKLGVDRIIHPEEEMGTRVAQALNYPMVNDYLTLGHGQYVVEVAVAQSTTVQALLKGFDDAILCLLHKQGDKLTPSPVPATELKADDIVLLCGPREALIRIAPRLTK